MRGKINFDEGATRIVSKHLCGITAIRGKEEEQVQIALRTYISFQFSILCYLKKLLT